MDGKYIKIARVIIALAFFLTISVVFLDIKHVVPISIADTVSYLQFIPSLTGFVATFSLSAVGFFFIILLTVLFGRVYCSTICPLGVLQDIFSFISRKLKKRKKYKFSRPGNRLRYSILAGMSVLFLFGGIFFVHLLDPFSIFGRINANVIRPFIVWINNISAGIFEASGLYILHPEVVKLAALPVILFSVSMFVLIAWLSFRHGRIYCNSLCPVGTFLGILSGFSVFKIGIDKEACDNCGECSIVCKARCIDIKRKSVDFSRCVGCFDCIAACPQSGINYKAPSFKKPATGPTNAVQRRVVIGAVFALLAVFMGSGKRAFGKTSIQPDKPTTIPENKQRPVCPPGAGSIEHFVSTCTACHLCVSACPSGVLQPSLLAYGVLGFMQPVMDFSRDFCNYECTRCTEVCPSGALTPLAVEEKKLTQTGTVHFIKENCVVHTDNTACGSCSEHCPTQAVHMVPYQNGLTIPEINQNVCIGCGACEYACPTRPFRAIYVDGNEIHVHAIPPEIKKPEDTPIEEFPF